MKTKKRVLVVDDSAVVRKSLKILLAGLDFEVFAAEDGFAALKTAKSELKTFDLFIVDINMPGMDGVELLTRLKSEIPKYKSTPKFVLTTESDPATVARAKEAGATVWMVKPYKEKIMRAGLRKLFGE